MIGMRVSGKTIYLTLMGSLLVWGQAPDVAKLQATLERNQRVLSDWPNPGPLSRGERQAGAGRGG